ncbi:MAG: hypothetical protein ABJA10_02800 [Aestuariivirga sp.]
MATLDQLRKERIIQSHHWQAAQWFAELPRYCPARQFIAEECRSIEALRNKFARRMNVDPLKLLQKACVSHETIPDNEHVVGVLRESLNAVARAMRLERNLN